MEGTPCPTRQGRRTETWTLNSGTHLVNLQPIQVLRAPLTQLSQEAAVEGQPAALTRVFSVQAGTNDHSILQHSSRHLILAVTS